MSGIARSLIVFTLFLRLVIKRIQGVVTQVTRYESRGNLKSVFPLVESCKLLDVEVLFQLDDDEHGRQLSAATGTRLPLHVPRPSALAQLLVQPLEGRARARRRPRTERRPRTLHALRDSRRFICLHACHRHR